MRVKNAGFSLIELLISVAVFSIIMLALSGLIVNGLQVRRGSSNEIQALAYANAFLERYKSHWIESVNYQDGIMVDAASLPVLPTGFTQEGPYFACIDEAGNEIDAVSCADSVPPLRRVSLSVKGADGTVLADLSTEIGNPTP